jgi:tetratricopeptide (TPR) repeat protein
MEPPDWKLTARQYPGNIYFKMGNYQMAEEAFKAALKRNRKKNQLQKRVPARNPP